MTGTLRQETGVTLVELMVSLALTALLAVGVLTIWGQTQQAYLDGAEASDAQQRVRIAMDQIARSIQMAGANPRNRTYAGAVSNDPAFTAFRAAGANCMRLYSDLDGTGDVQGARENLSFNWAGSGSPITQELGGGPDLGQVWVAASTGIQELSLDIVDNPGGIPMFQYFTGPNAAIPNNPIPVVASPLCENAMTNANRSTIGRVVITITARGTVGSQTFTRTLVSEARPRNVP
jgi:type II secretory pathway component PulJ